jgi:hypothetical protein
MSAYQKLRGHRSRPRRYLNSQVFEQATALDALCPFGLLNR